VTENSGLSGANRGSPFSLTHKRSSPTTFAAEPLRTLDYLRSVVAVAAITVTAIRIAAHVHPAIVRYPLDAGIVAVTVIRPRRRGERDASAYTPPRPEASTAKMSSAPIASPPVA
jgi:hypothetical protein